MLSRLLTASLAAFVAFATLIVATPAAHAATEGLSATLELNGQDYNGTDVLNEGDVVTLQVQYDNSVKPGSTATFTFGGALDAIQSVPEGNDAIESIETEGTTVKITFKDPWPAGTNQGVFNIKAKVKSVDQSETGKLTWGLDGDKTVVDVIVKNDGDDFANVTDKSSKSVSTGDLNQYVSVDDDGNVVLDPAITSHDLSYTLSLDSVQARANFPIDDQLPAGLGYVDGSFAATLTTWDEDGLNRSTDEFTYEPAVNGNSFTSTVDVPGDEARDPSGPSQLRITYKARVTDAAALQTQLQAEYDALDGKPGDYKISLTNEATFGETSQTAKFSFGGNVPTPPGPEPGAAFVKDASWQTVQIPSANVAEDGTLAPAQPITYTLGANLTKLAGKSDYQLSRNVVISDELPEQLTWNTDSADFIDGGDFALTAAADCPSATDFAADKYVGQYCVDGQTLLVNVGQDATTNAQVKAEALLTTVADLGKEGSSSVQDATRYKFRNEAVYYWDNERGPHTSGYSSFPVVLPDTDDGYHDQSAFSKTGKADATKVQPGETVSVDYTFKVAAGLGIDLSKSTIVDYLDQEAFDISDLDALAIKGNYAGHALTRDDFTLSTDADGNLVIALSDTGTQVVADAGVDKEFSATLTLTTNPFDGKETKTITNKATLFGEDDDPLYWDNTETESTSYGSEAEVRKRVYDRNADEGTNPWVETLKAYTDSEGNLVQNIYVYRVEFLPHGSYDNVVIKDVRDNLPDGVDFKGFVTEENAATGADATEGPVDVGGNIVATYDSENDRVLLTQKEGTKLDASQPIAAYFAVEITDGTAPIVNEIGSTSATVDPQDPPSIDVEKWSQVSPDSGPSYNENGTLKDDDYEGDFDEAPGQALEPESSQEVNFTISNDGGEPLKNIAVADELTDGANAINDLACTFPDESTGTTWGGIFAPGAQFTCTGTLDGLKAGENHQDKVKVTGAGLYSNDEVTDDDDWNAYAKAYAIGDYVWIDTNKDGVQDSDEDVLPGVTVELLNSEGDVVATTTTDEDGRYLFDDLAAGTYQVRFTLTDEQAAKYAFTKADEGSDAADSDADPETGLTTTIVLDDSNEALVLKSDYEFGEVHASQGIDPTWDAGVIRKTVSVGDYVWVDSNRDGIQDEGEPGIEGVTLEVVGPDGKPVTDVFGNSVESVVTDEDGYYTFENLPALNDDETYTVRIDREASEEALKPYVPTTENAEADRGEDSSTWNASTVPGELHNDGDRDPSLDFGFVTKSYAVGDYVWIDTNKDGVQDSDEDVLPGVTVELLNSEGDVVATTTTDENGRYLFDDLEAGTYQVRFTLTDEQAAKYAFTKADQGSDAADSDADPKTGLTTTIVLDDSNEALVLDNDYDPAKIHATEGIDPTWDAGVIRKSVSVGDYVWVDSNRDGIQDEGEPGIEGVTLELVGPDGKPVTDVFGNPVEPVITDENGHYTFENLPALNDDETYTVRIDRKASEEVLKPYVPTKENSDADRSEDSSTWNASTVPGELHNDGDRDPSLDFGFIKKSYAVGDYVWIDANKDGVQDSDEDVLPGVKVDLLNSDGDVVATTTTDEDGRYLFDDLAAGTYQVRFTLTDEQAAKYAFTKANIGKDGLDSDADPATGLTAKFVLDDSNEALTGDYDFADIIASQGIDPTWDAGVVLLEEPTLDTDKPSEDGEGPKSDTPVATPDSNGSAGNSGELSVTGTTVGLGVAGIALAMLVTGGFLVARKRRMQS